MGEDLQQRVDERLEQLRERADLLERYDVTGDGELDDQEWELVRRMITVELRTAEERSTTRELEDELEHATKRLGWDL